MTRGPRRPHRATTVDGDRSRRRRTLRSLVTGLLLALAGAAWLLTLAPSSLGGPVGTVVVDGTSMEPRFHTGDVVFVYRRPTYHLGDTVVAEVDGGEVVHPLWSGDARTGWRTKGINRRQPDSWLVPEDRIVGSYWFMIPQAGRWIADLRSPAGTGALCAAVGFLVVTLPAGRRRSRLHRTLGQSMRMARRAAQAAGSTAPQYRPLTPRPVEGPLLGVACALTAICALVDAASWLPDRGALAQVPLRLHGPGAVTLLVVTAVILIGDVLLAGRVLRAWGGSGADRAFALLRPRLVPVADLDVEGSVATVRTARELLQIADLCVSPVLHRWDGARHRFLVSDGLMAYVFEPVAEPVPVVDLRTLEPSSSTVVLDVAPAG